MVVGSKRLLFLQRLLQTRVRYLKEIGVTILLILTWYLMSVFLTATNKLLLDSLGFPYPLMVTFVHFTGVALVLRTAEVFLVNNDSVITVDLTTYLKIIMPIAIFTAAEVALSNQAYSMVSVAALTVLKSTLVAATYVASIITGLETFKLRLALVLVWIITSVAISVPGMEIGNPYGVAVIAVAVCFAAARWVLVHQQLKLKSFTSLELLSLTQPLSALCLLPAAALYDLPDILGDKFISSNLAAENLNLEPTDSERICAIFVLMFIAVMVACVLLFCEFRLIELTSSLTLTVAGVGKECLTIGMSTFFFKEKLRTRAVIGLLFSIAGITAYGIIRNQEAHTRQVGTPRKYENSLATGQQEV